ncbi:hypothetical protein [Actinomadura soli]|nr:hypothetical protein [Actinomadura soli]
MTPDVRLAALAAHLAARKLFTSWGEPIAPADRVIEAAVFVLGYLGEER